MERLTEWENGSVTYNEKREIECGEYCDSCSQGAGNCETIKNMIKKLAEYEDLEEQGLLVRLPCKVGNTVYTVSYRYECTLNYDCKVFQKWKCEENIPCEYEKKEYFVKKSQFCLTMLNSLGKTVFLTREEAEKALEKMGK